MAQAHETKPGALCWRPCAGGKSCGPLVLRNHTDPRRNATALDNIDAECREFIDDVIAYVASHAPADDNTVIIKVSRVLINRPELGRMAWHQRDKGIGEHTARHLEDADRLFDERGWTQGAYVGRDGGYCIAGALGNARPGQLTDTYGPAVSCIELVLRAEGAELTEFHAWNDAPGRTLAEVRRVFRLAAVVARHFGP